MVLRRVEPAAGGIEAEIPWRQDQATLPREQCMVQLGHLKMSLGFELTGSSIGGFVQLPREWTLLFCCALPLYSLWSPSAF